MRSSASSQVGVRDFGDRPRDADVGEVGELEARQHLEGDLEGEVGLRVERLFDLVLVLGEADLRLEREPEAVLVDDLAVRLVDGVLNHVGHYRLAVDLAQMRDRHLAGPEAVEAHLVLQGRELAREPLLELGCRQHDLELALEPLGQGFGDLHRLIRLCSFSPEPTSRPATI